MQSSRRKHACLSSASSWDKIPLSSASSSPPLFVNAYQRRLVVGRLKSSCKSNITSQTPWLPVPCACMPARTTAQLRLCRNEATHSHHPTSISWSQYRQCVCIAHDCMRGSFQSSSPRDLAPSQYAPLGHVKTVRSQEPKCCNGRQKEACLTTGFTCANFKHASPPHRPVMADSAWTYFWHAASPPQHAIFLSCFTLPSNHSEHKAMLAAPKPANISWNDKVSRQMSAVVEVLCRQVAHRCV